MQRYAPGCVCDWYIPRVLFCLSVSLFVFYQKDLVPKYLIIKFLSFNALEKCLLYEFASLKNSVKYKMYGILNGVRDPQQLHLAHNSWICYLPNQWIAIFMPLIGSHDSEFPWLFTDSFKGRNCSNTWSSCFNRNVIKKAAKVIVNLAYLCLLIDCRGRQATMFLYACICNIFLFVIW